MKKAFAIMLTAAMILSVLLSGCGNKDTAEAGETAAAEAETSEVAAGKDTLTIAYTTEPDSLYCFGTTKNMAEKMCANIYATLLKFDNNYQIVPYVAKSWELADDDVTYTFHLRDDVYFHDGKHMTSADVVYSLQAAKSSAYSSYFLEYADTITALDEYTVQIHLSSPYGAFLNMLCEPFLGIINEDSYNELGDKFAQCPVGSGPYKVVSWDAGSKLTLEAFDQFFEGEAPIKNVVVKFIPDPSTQLISLENGEVDVADSIATNNITSVEDDSKLAISKTASAKYNYMGFNNQSELFKNQKLRQAINYAINTDAIIMIAQDGIADHALCTISDQAFGYPRDMQGYSYDVAKAQELLNESGLENVQFDIICSNEVSKKVGEAIQSDLGKIGITVSISMLESGGYYDALGKSSFDAFIGSWSDSLMDAASVVGMRYGSSYVGDPGNYIWLMDKNVDDLIKAGEVQTDSKQRAATYAELFQYVHDQAFEVPLFYSISNLGYAKDLKGVQALTTGIYYYNNWSW
ncbi:MAG: ABC transporter substrate-binding protein [Oscillospiraceae bacterium]|nr:ABC transporter substrate-binding protein [Oscillospiraceae bacterium]